MKIVWIYLFIINMIGLFIMYSDKEKAKKGKYRIPEATLWKVTFVGGAIGTWLGMTVFHHKNRHATFRLGFSGMAILEVIIILYVVFF